MDYLQINFKIITANLFFNSESIEMIEQFLFCLGAVILTVCKSQC